MMILCACFVISLAVFMSIGVNGQRDCSFNGKTYANLEKFPHENGCATYQCQYGQVVVFHEACGKEIDGNCHRLNLMFNHKTVLGVKTYQCRKVGNEYKNEIAIARSDVCTEGDKTYKTLEKFRRGDGCREYQCQNGVVVALDPVCEKNVDGKCHQLNELFEKEETVYSCTKKEDGENTIYENKVLEPQPAVKKGCASKDYTKENYEIFTIPPLCHLRQCQNGQVKIITTACAFKRETIQCKQIGEQWFSSDNNNTYQCNYDATKNEVSVDTVTKGYGKCKRGEHWYNHLEVHARPGGCTSVQCQDGKTLPVEEGCLWNVDNKCYELNSVWKGEKGGAVKCILTEDGLYRVVQLDDNGNIIDREEPTDASLKF